MLTSQYTKDMIDALRAQVLGYMKRNRMSVHGLADHMQIMPQTLLTFLEGTRKPSSKTLYAIEQFMDEYDLVDFRVKKKELK